jgi:hypothetical protein
MQVDSFAAGGDDPARHRLRAGIIDVGDGRLGKWLLD